MTAPNNLHQLVVGSPGAGKSVSAAREFLEFDGAGLLLDPHKDSLASLVLDNISGNFLFDRLSDSRFALGYELLKPSTLAGSSGYDQNLLRIEAFKEILLRQRDMANMSGAPLMDEMITAILMLFMFQAKPKSLSILPFGFLPGTPQFAALVRDCRLPEVRAKFEALWQLSPKALRSEIGSSSRLIQAVFRSTAFLARCHGGFDLPAFIQAKGKLIVEKGDDIDDDAARTIMCGIVTLLLDHAKGRKSPWPPILIIMDECTNARLAGRREEKAAAEMRKYNVKLSFLCQWLNMPGGADGFLQNCGRKIVFRINDYDLARKMAAIVEAGLPGSTVTVSRKDGDEDKDEARAARIARLTREIMNLRVGERYVVDRDGSRKDQVPMLDSGPDWPGYQEGRREEILTSLLQRKEYQTRETPPSGEDEEPPSSTSSPGTPVPPPSSPPASGAAARWKRGGGRPQGGS